MDIVLRKGMQLYQGEGVHHKLHIIAQVWTDVPMVIKDFREPGLIVTWERGNVVKAQVINKPK